MEVLTGKVIAISIFLLIITMIETLAYSTRISGTRVKLIATAISLFSTLVLVSRFSSMIQQPLTAKLIAEAPEINKLSFIEEQYRIFITVTSLSLLSVYYSEYCYFQLSLTYSLEPSFNYQLKGGPSFQRFPNNLISLDLKKY